MGTSKQTPSDILADYATSQARRAAADVRLAERRRDMWQDVATRLAAAASPAERWAALIAAFRVRHSNLLDSRVVGVLLAITDYTQTLTEMVGLQFCDDGSVFAVDGTPLPYLRHSGPNGRVWVV